MPGRLKGDVLQRTRALPVQLVHPAGIRTEWDVKWLVAACASAVCSRRELMSSKFRKKSSKPPEHRQPQTDSIREPPQN